MKLLKLIPAEWMRVQELSKIARLKLGNAAYHVGLLKRMGLVEHCKMYSGGHYERYCRRLGRNVEKAVAL
jgi:hypothetical protein